MPEIVKTKRTKVKKSRRSFSPPVSYLLSAFKGLAVSLLLMGGLSILLLNNGSFSPFYKVLCYISAGLGAFVCGFCAYRAIRSRGIVNGAVGSAAYCGALMLALILLMRFDIGAQILLLLPVSVGCGVAGGIAGANL